MLFLILSVIVSNLVAFLIPKNLSKKEMYATSMFAVYFATVTDIYLNLRHDLYGYFSIGANYISLLAVWGLYPSANIIILNYFPFGKGIKPKIIYILAWSAFLVVFEWASVKSGYFYHSGWKYWYSALVYPIILVILVWNLILFRRLTQK